MEAVKEKLFEEIDRQMPQMIELADKLYDLGELGHEEYVGCETCCNYLKEQGFQVEKGVGGVPTALRAEYQSLEGGPSLGFLFEYDALPGSGHACGHHMQPGANMSAAIALKEVLGGKLPFTLVLYSTPDEECNVTSGKVEMLQAGCFEDVDVVLSMHGGNETTTDLHTLAMRAYEVTFSGKRAHACAHPEDGRSAFDGLQMAFHAVEFLREHVSDSARMHYTLTDNGGTPSNVVPDKAVGLFYLRAMKNGELADICERFENILKGAALMTGTQVEYTIRSDYKAMFPVMPLTDCFYENAPLSGAQLIEPPRKETGSTDFGNVMEVTPCFCVRIHFAPKGTGAHSRAWYELGKSEAAHQAIAAGAKTMAGMGYDILTKPDLLHDIRTAWLKEREISNAL